MCTRDPFGGSIPWLYWCAAEGDIVAGVVELCKLKGIGPATASAVLAAAMPDVPFMSDELMMV
jgi:hypothetical protein